MLIEDSNEYRDHPKATQAVKLLREAYYDILDKRKRKTAAAICECTHRRDQHGPSYNINYTGGVCLDESCKCRNFLMKRK